VTGFMAREFFGASPILILPVVALVLFAVVFVALAVRAARMDRGEVHDHAQLALQGDQEAPRG
tara:strand:+ start:651 stop:839 length:189 start_codon:yes stop_codon:yes gene_type:complete